MTGILLRGVRVQYGGRDILDGVDVEIPTGEFVAIVGPNGAGKSTLLRAAVGLVPGAFNEVEIDGTRLSTLSRRRLATKVAWLPQRESASWLEGPSVHELVENGRYRFDESRADSHRAVRAALERVDAHEFMDRDVSSLSGGEAQRVAIAAVLAQETQTLLFDEPASHLDPGQQIRIYRLLGKLWREGRSIGCVSHDINLLHHLDGPRPPRVVGIACGGIRFDMRSDDDALGPALEDLFDVRFASTRVGQHRYWMPAGERRK